jgi:hypothetical protein
VEAPVAKVSALCRLDEDERLSGGLDPTPVDDALMVGNVDASNGEAFRVGRDQKGSPGVPTFGRLREHEARRERGG